MLHSETETAIQCSRCRYDLREIAKESVCPECGLPVAITLRDPDSVRLDQQWLAALERGRRWLDNVFPAVVIAGSAVVVLLIVATGSMYAAFHRFPSIYLSIVFLDFVSLAVGVFLFSDKSGKRWLAGHEDDMRRLMRFAALTPPGLVLVGLWCLCFAGWDGLEVVSVLAMGFTILVFLFVLLFGSYCNAVAKVLVDEAAQDHITRLRRGWVFWCLALPVAVLSLSAVNNIIMAIVVYIFIGVTLSSLVACAVRTFRLPLQFADRMGALRATADESGNVVVNDELAA